ncbi:MAG: phosphoribosyltransferase family protein [Thermodesulfobacteriota bacterium]|nr:MAG: phosphoribosyltransferase family protein [Thermodesulfobacteriota bacterium]
MSGRDVIIVEDIIDRGHTAKALMKYFSDRGAASIRLCTLLKREGGAPELKADYTGAIIGPGFVVGYGMDYKERLRGLPGPLHRSGRGGAVDGPARLIGGL